MCFFVYNFKTQQAPKFFCLTFSPKIQISFLHQSHCAFFVSERKNTLNTKHYVCDLTIKKHTRQYIKCNLFIKKFVSVLFPIFITIRSPKE